MTDTISANIPVENVQDLVKTVEKLARKAVKLDLPVPALVLGEEFGVPVMDKDDQPTGEVRLMRVVTVTGAFPRHQGWEFVGVLTLVEGMVLTSARPGSVIPAEFRSPDTCQTCDHCRTRRRRTETFVIRHTETGEHLRVGRQCLADFCGRKDITDIVSIAQVLWEMLSGDDEESMGGGGGGGVYAADIDRFLATVASITRQIGFMTNKQARALNGD